MVIFVLVIAAAQSTFVVEPGYRGVRVTLGKVSPVFEPEGFGFKPPFITHVDSVLVRQQTHTMDAECYSSDLQHVKTKLKVLYRIPEASVVTIYRDYEGDPFDTLIAPRMHEALKEVTAHSNAETIVQKREDIKTKALELARKKIGEILQVEDLVIEDIALTPELEAAIEMKMVQEQEANKAKFTQQKTDIEARTAVIRAQGEAESISIRGEALAKNPELLELEIVQRWDGKAPLVLGGGVRGTQMILPISNTPQGQTPAAKTNAR
ncbi:MAG: prohibitin family protein [Verrucomicrobiota bacterium]